MTFSKKPKHPKAAWMSVRGAKPVRCAVRAAKPPKARSKTGAARMVDYYIVRDAYMAAHPRCEAVWDGVACSKRSDDVHHKRGRLGEALCDTSSFVALCRGCHCKVHLNPALAIRHGYLPPRGYWNTTTSVDHGG